MEDKLHNFFSENEFDFHEPNLGHMKRFEKRLKGEKTQNKFSWKWMSVAASVVLLVGFSLGFMTKNSLSNTNNDSSKIQQVEAFFISAINTELQEVEMNRNLQTEGIIEDALEQIEELDDSYKRYIEELNNSGEYRQILNDMIENYKKRLEILQSAMYQIDLVKNPEKLENFII
tara:strand:+ start:10607 stop:11128 length:522 start_codon:yes stop_codon:yes gene_type:complete